MPLPDYYQILQVRPSATIEEIKKAYRKLAFNNHPDRGGSHERMLAINEAFFVLANASARADYDQSRMAQASEETRQRAEQYSAKAASAAGDYPKNYQEFNGWVDGLIKDIANARYGSKTEGAFNYPTVENSTSGGVFLVAGGLAGFGVALLIAMNVGFDNNGTKLPILWFGAVIAGMWVGQFLHGCVKGAVTGNQPACAGNTGGCAPAMAQGTVERQLLVVCPKCSQKLRAGSSRVGSQLRCPQCRTEFTMR